MEDKTLWVDELPEDRIAKRDKLITDKLAEIFAEWTELKIKLLCREQRIKQMKMHLNVAIICLSGIVVCLLILLITGVE